MTLLDTLPTISSLYNKLLRINLSNNTYAPVIVNADERERLVGGVNMYEWWAGYSKDGNITPEDMDAFSTLTKTGSLQKRFAEDPTPVSFRAAMQHYVEEFVKLEYQHYFDEILDSDQLGQMLSERVVVQFTYKKTNGVWVNGPRQDSAGRCLYVLNQHIFMH